MIVNPQAFNYRLTIGTLVVAIAILAVYGFSSYSEVTSNNEYLQHEKKLLQSELNKIINNYDELGSENVSLKSEIESEQTKLEVAQDSLDLLKVDVEIIPRYREQIVFLKQENKELQSNSLSEVVNAMVEEKVETDQLLVQQENEIVSLNEEKLQLEETLKNGKLIYANSFDANVFRRKNSGEIVETNKASNADFVEVCFVIGENPLSSKGERELYIQILGPDNNVVGDQGAVHFGESSLIYSSKIYVQYDNQTEEVCAAIKNDDKFKKGKYYISVFEKERKLGHTQIDLY